MFCFDSRLRRIFNTCEFNLEIMSFGGGNAAGGAICCNMLASGSLLFSSASLIFCLTRLNSLWSARVGFMARFFVEKHPFFIKYAAQYGAVQQTHRGVKVLSVCCATLCSCAGANVAVTRALFGKKQQNKKRLFLFFP